MARVGNGLSIQTSVGVRVDPKLVLASHVLQLTQAELDQVIENELNENPALERVQDDSEPITEEVILRSVAPQELRPSGDDFEWRRSLPNDDDKADWTDFAASAPSLTDHLRAQLLPALPQPLWDLGEFVIGSLNDRGYLATPAEEIALLTDHTLDEVELVVDQLRRCEPAGIGASTVCECLLLQLRDAQTLEQKLARAILKNHLDDFLSRRTSRIMRRYGVLPEVVHGAFGEILSLTPYPADGFSHTPTLHVLPRKAAVSPDLILVLEEAGWRVEVVGPDPVSFAINRGYRQRFEELKQARRVPPEERAHVTEYVNRAGNFIQSLSQRRQTLQRIGEQLIREQSGFVTTGRYEFLRAMTRTKLAHDLGIHESTVSRATQGKFVQIANGEVVAFEVFFKPALRVQKMIEEILQHENPNNPLSDETIARMLADRGVYVARRTVNKYRDRGRLLSSRKRRSA